MLLYILFRHFPYGFLLWRQQLPMRWYRCPAVTNSFLEHVTCVERQFVSLESWRRSRASWDGALRCLDPSVETSGAPASPSLPWPAAPEPGLGARGWTGGGPIQPCAGGCRGHQSPTVTASAGWGQQLPSWPAATPALPSWDLRADTQLWHLFTLP